jgi:hypothetical protein
VPQIFGSGTATRDRHDESANSCERASQGECTPSGGGAGAGEGREPVGLQVERRLQKAERIVASTLFSVTMNLLRDCDFVT